MLFSESTFPNVCWDFSLKRLKIKLLRWSGFQYFNDYYFMLHRVVKIPQKCKRQESAVIKLAFVMYAMRNFCTATLNCFPNVGPFQKLTKIPF